MPVPLFLIGLKAFFAPAKIIGLLKGSFVFVVKYWKQCLFIGMAGLIFHQNFMEWEVLKWVGIRTLPGIQQELVVKDQQLELCEISREALKSEIESVNAQVDKWADVSKQLQNQHDELVAEIGEMRKKSEAAVQDILAGPTPETCEAAIEFLKEAAQGELRWQRQ